MDRKEKILYHQIHPAKLATDILSVAISLLFFWQHQLVPALLVHVVPPIVASALLIRYAELDRYRDSAFGRYVSRYMTRPFDLLRLMGDIMMVLGAWLNRPQFMLAGFIVIAGAWANGLLRLKNI